MLIDNKWRVMNSRQFCIKCSPFMAHNTKSILSDHSHHTQTGTKLCSQCNKIKNKSEFYTNKNVIHGSKCKECFNANSVEKQQQMKIRMIEYLGGKCIICDYNNAPSALAFHHIHSNEKDHTLTRLTTRSWKNITSELDKCVLLCVRCHSELHYSDLSEHHRIITETYYNKKYTRYDSNIQPSP